MSSSSSRLAFIVGHAAQVCEHACAQAAPLAVWCHTQGVYVQHGAVLLR